MNVAVKLALVATLFTTYLYSMSLSRHGEQRVEAHVDLGLAGRAHFMVLHFDLDAHVLQGEDHLRAQVLEMVHGRDGEIPLLVPGLEAEVGLLVLARVPDTFYRVDEVIALVGVLVEADVVENEELGLRAEIGRVCQTSGDQVVLRLLGDISAGRVNTTPR